MDINNEDAVYNVAITMLPGLGGVGVRNLVRRAGSARAVFENVDMLQAEGQINPRTAESIRQSSVLQMAREQLEVCARHNINIHYFEDLSYPRKLAAGEGAPALLYSLGKVNYDAYHTVGIVGTRSCDGDGKANIFALVEQLKENNINVVIISGLAAGADTYAHQAALKYELPTVGVLGHGLNMVYPAENRKLAGDIVHSGGALITEYYYGQPVSKTNFPRRNRIIAGLCDALVVAQSKSSGGALITADVAHELRKDVFAFPGRISDRLYAGCNQLIADNKATLITSADDLTKHMGWSSRLIPLQTEMNLEPLTENEVRIMDILHADGMANIDTLSIKTGIPIPQISSILLDMEFKDLVVGLPGRKYEAR